MDKKRVLETLFDRKMVKILRLLVNNQGREFYLREIARATKVSPATTYRTLKLLKGLEMVEEKKDRYLKVYSAHPKNILMFADLLEDKSAALREFTDFIATVPGVQQAILHGEEEKERASIIIVGIGVSQEMINPKVVEIKGRFNFTIIFMVLSPDQYTQMLNMGLYSGKKTVLFAL
jgi:DNA-binding transcriptional ArsR family regulator